MSVVSLALLSFFFVDRYTLREPFSEMLKGGADWGHTWLYAPFLTYLPLAIAKSGSNMSLLRLLVKCI